MLLLHSRLLRGPQLAPSQPPLPLHSKLIAQAGTSNQAGPALQGALSQPQCRVFGDSAETVRQDRVCILYESVGDEID
jgi:hypothetical protein